MNTENHVRLQKLIKDGYKKLNEANCIWSLWDSSHIVVCKCSYYRDLRVDPVYIVCDTYMNEVVYLDLEGIPKNTIQTTFYIDSLLVAFPYMDGDLTTKQIIQEIQESKICTNLVGDLIGAETPYGFEDLGKFMGIAFLNEDCPEEDIESMYGSDFLG